DTGHPYVLREANTPRSPKSRLRNNDKKSLRKFALTNCNLKNERKIVKLSPSSLKQADENNLNHAMTSPIRRVLFDTPKTPKTKDFFSSPPPVNRNLSDIFLDARKEADLIFGDYIPHRENEGDLFEKFMSSDFHEHPSTQMQQIGSCDQVDNILSDKVDNLLSDKVDNLLSDLLSDNQTVSESLQTSFQPENYVPDDILQNIIDADVNEKPTAVQELKSSLAQKPVVNNYMIDISTLYAILTGLKNHSTSFEEILGSFVRSGINSIDLNQVLLMLSNCSNAPALDVPIYDREIPQLDSDGETKSLYLQFLKNLNKDEFGINEESDGEYADKEDFAIEEFRNDNAVKVSQQMQQYFQFLIQAYTIAGCMSGGEILQGVAYQYLIELGYYIRNYMIDPSKTIEYVNPLGKKEPIPDPLSTCKFHWLNDPLEMESFFIKNNLLKSFCFVEGYEFVKELPRPLSVQKTIDDFSTLNSHMVCSFKQIMNPLDNSVPERLVFQWRNTENARRTFGSNLCLPVELETVLNVFQPFFDSSLYPEFKFDELLLRGLSRFGSCAAAMELICKYYLPLKTPKQISNRYKNVIQRRNSQMKEKFRQEAAKKKIFTPITPLKMPELTSPKPTHNRSTRATSSFVSNTPSQNKTIFNGKEIKWTKEEDRAILNHIRIHGTSRLDSLNIQKSNPQILARYDKLMQIFKSQNQSL
ncbi:hypothetical protein ROZALSC1DRAFT_29216, partial [Rozella allomycis CSF55]